MTVISPVPKLLLTKAPTPQSGSLTLPTHEDILCQYTRVLTTHARLLLPTPFQLPNPFQAPTLISATR